MEAAVKEFLGIAPWIYLWISGIAIYSTASSGYAVPYQAFRICLGGAVKETTRRDGRLFETWT